MKLRTEQLVRDSGLPYAIYCPTWVKETLQNFIRGGKWAIVVDGKTPPASALLRCSRLRPNGRCVV